MSDPKQSPSNGATSKPDRRIAVPEIDSAIDPQATDDYPTPDELLDEELEGSFPASDAPSSTPTTSLGGPDHPKEKSEEASDKPLIPKR